MQIPPYLQPGDTIGITCPSGFVSSQRIVHCMKVLSDWGFTVKIGRTVNNGEHYMAGTDEERTQDLQAMLDDPTIKAIIMGRGGYGMSRIVDALDFTQFAAQPKWICGFSDITALHSHIHQHLQIATLHSPMCGHFKPETEKEPFLLSLLKQLTGAPLIYRTPADAYNKPGIAEGMVVGGNLSLLAHLTGTPSDINTDDKILFIEDLDEYLYHIDRMMIQLKRAGKLKQLKALLVGGFTDMKDTERPFGKNYQEIILDAVREYDYPVCFQLPFGHQDVNFTLPLGVTATLKSTQQGGQLHFFPEM